MEELPEVHRGQRDVERLERGYGSGHPAEKWGAWLVVIGQIAALALRVVVETH